MTTWRASVDHWLGDHHGIITADKLIELGVPCARFVEWWRRGHSFPSIQACFEAVSGRMV